MDDFKVLEVGAKQASVRGIWSVFNPVFLVKALQWSLCLFVCLFCQSYVYREAVPLDSWSSSIFKIITGPSLTHLIVDSVITQGQLDNPELIYYVNFTHNLCFFFSWQGLTMKPKLAWNSWFPFQELLSQMCNTFNFYSLFVIRYIQRFGR